MTAEVYFDKTAKEDKKYEPRIATRFKEIKKAGKYHADKDISGAKVIASGTAAGAIGGTAGVGLGAGILKAGGKKLRGGWKKNLAAGVLGGGAIGGTMIGVPYGLGRLSSKKKKKRH